MSKSKIKSGDIVEILSFNKISETLDQNGTLDGLPFMPEMIKYCNKTYRVKFKVEKTCVSCLFSANIIKNRIREFIFNDIVFLENMRCDGNFHDGCQEGCMIFWKSSWLKNPELDAGYEPRENSVDMKAFKKLKVKVNDKKYFCQSTQLHDLTRKLSVPKKLKKLAQEIARGEIGLFIAFKSMTIPVIRKLTYQKNFRNNPQKTPTESLHLKPGEIVEVKSWDEILQTLNHKGRNRGLNFYHDMKQYCGKKLIVRNRLDNMINEATKEMMKVQNTVILKDSICSYEHSFLGCPRERFHIWREIWLKRA